MLMKYLVYNVKSLIFINEKKLRIELFHILHIFSRVNEVANSWGVFSYHLAPHNSSP